MRLDFKFFEIKLRSIDVIYKLAHPQTYRCRPIRHTSHLRAPRKLSQRGQGFQLHIASRIIIVMIITLLRFRRSVFRQDLFQSWFGASEFKERD